MAKEKLIESFEEVEETEVTAIAPSVPQSAISQVMAGVAERGMVTTFDTSTIEGKKRVYNAANNAKALSQFMETPIQVSDMVFKTSQLTDSDTGEVRDVVSVFLISPDGTAYLSSSTGVVKCSADILSTFGNPSEWGEPLTVVCHSTDTKGGMRYKMLEVC